MIENHVRFCRLLWKICDAINTFLLLFILYYFKYIFVVVGPASVLIRKSVQTYSIRLALRSVDSALDASGSLSLPQEIVAHLFSISAFLGVRAVVFINHFLFFFPVCV
jgi:hypothetical protein